MLNRLFANQKLVGLVVVLSVVLLTIGCSSDPGLKDKQQTGQLTVDYSFTAANSNQISIQNIKDQSDKVDKIKIKITDQETDKVVNEKEVSKDQTTVPFTLAVGEYKIELTAIQETSEANYILYRGSKTTQVVGSNTTDLRVAMKLTAWTLTLDVSNLQGTKFNSGKLILSNSVDGKFEKEFSVDDGSMQLDNIVPGSWNLKLHLLSGTTKKVLAAEISTLPDRKKQVVVDLTKNTPLTIIETSTDQAEEVTVTSEDYPQIPEAKANQTMLQAFYWNLGINNTEDTSTNSYYTAKEDYRDKYSAEKELWDLIADRADEFAEVGITELWLPPAHKASHPHKVGYAVYDLWDLGEFDQKGSVETKYGSKAELKAAIDALHEEGIKAYYDIVMNQRLGADDTEVVPLKNGGEIEAWTEFNNLKGRQKYYSKASEFSWDWNCFDGVDYGVEKGKLADGVLFEGKSWDQAYPDYLLGADVDYQNTNVQHELKEWGTWIINEVGFDGFRIDAIKHVHTPFISDWLEYVQSNTNKDVFYVGEAWIGNVGGLEDYLSNVDYSGLKNFDFPLRQALADIDNASFDMSSLAAAGLVNSTSSNKAVTFLDNHDTHRDCNPYGKDQIENYKCQAYTYILMRESGVPTIFWKDYYQHGLKPKLDKLLKARKYYAYGTGFEVTNNDDDVYSYVREGLDEIPGTGLVMMISDGTSGEVVTKTINARQSKVTYVDITGNVSGTVTTDPDGYGEFKVNASATEGWSVWVPVQ